MSLLRLRAIEHGVEENDLGSVGALGEVLPLLARLKEGQVSFALLGVNGAAVRDRRLLRSNRAASLPPL